VFVTHDMSAVERFCDRAMLLEKGHVLEIGEPDHVAERYREVNFGSLAAAGGNPPELEDPEVHIRRVWIENDSGERILSSFQGERCEICMEVEFLATIEHPVFSVTFRNDVQHTIFVATSAPHPAPGPFSAGDRAVIRLSFVNWLAPSRYGLTPTIETWDPDHRVVSQREDLASLIVDAPRRTGGATDLPTELEVERL
jgi:hypothetical protein